MPGIRETPCPSSDGLDARDLYAPWIGRKELMDGARVCCCMG